MSSAHRAETDCSIIYMQTLLAVSEVEMKLTQKHKRGKLDMSPARVKHKPLMHVKMNTTKKKRKTLVSNRVGKL